MSEVIGRAGFHLVHVTPSSDRGAVLHEMMRELDDDSIAYWAERNPNIVVEDEKLNEAFVNDGQGGFKRCSDRKEVLSYGDQRLGRVGRKITLPKEDGRGGTITTTLIASHLPKSMCREIPNYYPVIDKKTKEQAVDRNGELMWRSRWVARDRDEARRYFEDVIEYLNEHVVSGGQASLLGYDIQHSESTPHVQLMFDNFEDHPTEKKPENLRASASRTWFSHRDILREDGKPVTGKQKLRNYHAGLKAFLVEKGYEISPDFDEERHMIGYTKEDFENVQDRERVLEEGQAQLAADKAELQEDEEISIEWQEELLERKEGLDKRERELVDREMKLSKREKDVSEREEKIAPREAVARKKYQEGQDATQEALKRVRAMKARVKALKEREEALQPREEALSAGEQAVKEHQRLLSNTLSKANEYLSEAKEYNAEMRKAGVKLPPLVRRKLQGKSQLVSEQSSSLGDALERLEMYESSRITRSDKENQAEF